mmetsp:Transcript_20058/g.56368  ORF Transcript_20058/g.56368 Transcript_20058/m.56368 type:complete len:621 (-) Transcript_20058:1548-3410(-)
MEGNVELGGVYPSEESCEKPVADEVPVGQGTQHSRPERATGRCHFALLIVITLIAVVFSGAFLFFYVYATVVVVAFVFVTSFLNYVLLLLMSAYLLVAVLLIGAIFALGVWLQKRGHCTIGTFPFLAGSAVGLLLVLVLYGSIHNLAYHDFVLVYRTYPEGQCKVQGIESEPSSNPDEYDYRVIVTVFVDGDEMGLGATIPLSQWELDELPILEDDTVVDCAYQQSNISNVVESYPLTEQTYEVWPVPWLHVWEDGYAASSLWRLSLILVPIEIVFLLIHVGAVSIFVFTQTPENFGMKLHGYRPKEVTPDADGNARLRWIAPLVRELEHASFLPQGPLETSVRRRPPLSVVMLLYPSKRFTTPPIITSSSGSTGDLDPMLVYKVVESDMESVGLSVKLQKPLEWRSATCAGLSKFPTKAGGAEGLLQLVSLGCFIMFSCVFLSVIWLLKSDYPTTYGPFGFVLLVIFVHLYFLVSLISIQSFFWVLHYNREAHIFGYSPWKSKSVLSIYSEGRTGGSNFADVKIPITDSDRKVLLDDMSDDGGSASEENGERQSNRNIEGGNSTSSPSSEAENNTSILVEMPGSTFDVDVEITEVRIPKSRWAFFYYSNMAKYYVVTLM